MFFYCKLTDKRMREVIQMNTSGKCISAPTTHEEMIAEWMADPEFKAEYDALEEEYQLVAEMLRAKKYV